MFIGCKVGVGEEVIVGLTVAVGVSVWVGIGVGLGTNVEVEVGSWAARLLLVFPAAGSLPFMVKDGEHPTTTSDIRMITNQ